MTDERPIDRVAETGLPITAAIVDLVEPGEPGDAERQLASIVESSDDAMISKSLDGLVLSWNNGAERLFGYTAEETAGKSLALLLPADRQEEEAELLARLQQGQVIDHFETVRQRKDGQPVDVSLTISPLKDAEGTIVGISQIARDITESKRAEANTKQANEQLLAALKELEAFSYSVSHDLRAPLRAIAGFAHVLEEDYGERLDAEGRRLLGVIRANAAMMSQLIDDLLSFSQLSRRAVEPQPVDMTELARSAYVEALSLVPDRRIDFRLATLPVISGDPIMLRQVWTNLLSNAIKYTRPRAHALIEITSVVEGREARFSIHDNGVGYDTKYAHKLFGVFQRLHKASEFEGTGVGLSLVQRIVERHGGRVWASSILNEGSTFEFALPTGEAECV